jgi:hypothetical protein
MHTDFRSVRWFLVTPVCRCRPLCHTMKACGVVDVTARYPHLCTRWWVTFTLLLLYLLMKEPLITFPLDRGSVNSGVGPDAQRRRGENCSLPTWGTQSENKRCTDELNCNAAVEKLFHFLDIGIFLIFWLTWSCVMMLHRTTPSRRAKPVSDFILG